MVVSYRSLKKKELLDLSSQMTAKLHEMIRSSEGVCAGMYTMELILCQKYYFSIQFYPQK